MSCKKPTRDFSFAKRRLNCAGTIYTKKLKKRILEKLVYAEQDKISTWTSEYDRFVTFI